MWRTKIATFVSVLLLATVGLSASAQVPFSEKSSFDTYGWQIDSFDSSVQLYETGALGVTETIETHFNPVFGKHGIYRDIPYAYFDRLGNRVKVRLHIDSILQNGLPAEYTTSRSDGYLHIRIGDANVEIDGPVEYQIRYTVNRAILYFDEYDEVYWNVTGTEWDLSIDQSSATVHLPEGATAEQAVCYTGVFGSTARDCQIEENANAISFTADDFLTVAVAFNKGVVPEPTFFDYVWYFVSDNWVALIPLFIIAGLFSVWFNLGRDPKMRTVIAEFEPPEKMDAVYAGFLLKNNYASQFTAAMIVQMAVKGYLQIISEETKGVLGIKGRKVHLKKLKPGTDLDESHKLLFNAIFKDGMKEVSLEQIKKHVGDGGVIPKVIISVRKRAIDEGWYAKRSFGLRTLIFAIVTVPMVYITFATWDAFGTITGVSFIIATILSALFAYLMPQRTLKGAELARLSEGFKLFMYTAERYRSKWQEEQNMFTDYLPYAIAYNQVDKWARTFKDLPYHQPDWYVSDRSFASSMDFASSLTIATTSLRGAMSYQSHSSGGSGGGGHSGGGFGGGGGGSW